MNKERNVRPISANSVPRYELIDKDGKRHGPAEGFECRANAIAAAVLMWPDRDDWTIQLADADFIWQRSNAGPVKVN